MSFVVQAMIGLGIAALAAGSFLVRSRVAGASGAGKILVLAPLFEATALAMFAAEHFFDAHELAGIVPHWLPGHLFWTYVVGVAWLAAAVSLIAWRSVAWTASLLAVLFVTIVVTIDLPLVPTHFHERLFWTLTVRELAFAAGAMVLAGSQWPRAGATSKTLMFAGRLFLAGTFVFYAIQHFLFPLFVPGVPLEKMTPAWIPAKALISYCVGATLLVTGIGVMVRRVRGVAAAFAGSVLLLLTIFFYVPIFCTETHSPLALEGLNYVGDTLLFAATALLAGFDAGPTNV